MTAPATAPAVPTARLPGWRRRPARPERWAALAVVVATLALIGYPLSGNVRYEVGVHRVSGYSVAETFSHRPITFRLLAAAQAWLPEVVSALAGPPGSLGRVWLFETSFRLGAALWCAIAALLLGAGLRKRFGTDARAYAAAVFAGLMFTAPATGEPDWLAAVLAVAAVGAGLLGRRAVGGLAGGVLLALAALVKISSLPVALAALVLLWALDHGRGWTAAASALVVGLLVVAAIAAWAPHEIAWLLDIRALQPDPWTRLQAIEAGNYLANVAARWPTIALLPAFFVGRCRREGWPVAAAIGLICLGIAMQGQYYVYHSMALVALSSVLAVRTLKRSGTALHLPVLTWCAWTLMLFLLPADWRVGHTTVLFSATAAWATGLSLWQWRALRHRRSLPGRTPIGSALVVVAAMLVTQTPASAESLTLGTSAQTPLVSHAALRAELATAAYIRGIIGAHTPVVYLAFGSTTYTLGNPTHCRYPSPLFLQRPEAEDAASPATRMENLACVTEPSARWLVWDRGWLHRKGAPADLIAAIDGTWDCGEALLAGPYTVCPRRPA